MSAPIRLGVIGAGAAVRTLHAPVLATLHHDIVPVSVAARSHASAAECAALLRARKVVTDYRELLADQEIDAVLTAVPIETNGQVLADAVASGKHVLAEKPLAATIADAAAAMSACDHARGVVMIAENFLYRRDVAIAREFLDGGELGDVFAFRVASVFDLHTEPRRLWTNAEWRRSGRHTGGFVLDAGVHVMSVVRHLLGEVAEVTAITQDRSQLLRGPDSLLMQMTMASGAAGQYFTAYTAVSAEERLLDLELLCARGALQISPRRVVHRSGAAARTFRTSTRDRGYGRMWLNFCAAVRGEERVLATPSKCFGDVAAIEAGLESARTRLPRRVFHLAGIGVGQAAS